MRYLIELGSLDSIYYTVFCCSHVVIAFSIFMILEFNVTFYSLLYELFLIFYHDMNNEMWAIFHGISLISMVSGIYAICDKPPAIIFYGCRLLFLLGITIARFVISIRGLSSDEEPAFQDLLNLFQVIPAVLYTMGIFLIIHLFSYSTGRYRGYYDVDDVLRNNVKKKFEEFEANMGVTTKTE